MTQHRSQTPRPQDARTPRRGADRPDRNGSARPGATYEAGPNRLRGRDNPRLDPRGPLVLDTRDVGRRAGSLHAVHRTVPAPADLGLELVTVPVGSDLELDLRMESVMEGVLVSGRVSVQLAGECGRCLDPLTARLDVSVQELYVYPDSTTDETTEESEFSRIGAGDLIDVEPAVRDAVVLALPMTPLCDPDCAGLCVGCGERLDDLPADHDHPLVDPRWAALADRMDDGSGPTGTTG